MADQFDPLTGRPKKKAGFFVGDKPDTPYPVPTPVPPNQPIPPIDEPGKPNQPYPPVPTPIPPNQPFPPPPNDPPGPGDKPDVPPNGPRFDQPDQVQSVASAWNAAPGPVVNATGGGDVPSPAPTPIDMPTNPQPGQPGGTPIPEPPAPTPAPAPAPGGNNADPSAIRDAWMGSGGRTSADLRAFVAAHPEFGITIMPGKGDKIRLPNGQIIDAIYATDSAQGHSQWYDPAGEAAGGGSGGAPGGGGPGGAGPQDPRWQQLLDMLLQRSQQSLAIDRNDPTIRAQADPYAAQQERSSRNYLADLAEKSGPNANLRGEQRMASEHAGQAAGGYEAELIGRELVARRNEIAQALQSYQGALTFEQQQALQQKLAEMDNAIKNKALDQENAQFLSRLGFDTADRSSYWDWIKSGGSA